MQLHNVAVGHRVVGANVLALEFRMAPDARVLERALEVLVHEPRDMAHCFPAAQGERPALVGRLPLLHRDPFDRMLAAQSLVEGVPILGRDQALAGFGVELVW